VASSGGVYLFYYSYSYPHPIATGETCRLLCFSSWQCDSNSRALAAIFAERGGPKHDISHERFKENGAFVGRDTLRRDVSRNGPSPA